MADSSTQDSADLVRFYDEAYSQTPERSAQYARWRALGAIGKADHVISLCEREGIGPAEHAGGRLRRRRAAVRAAPARLRRAAERRGDHRCGRRDRAGAGADRLGGPLRRRAPARSRRRTRPGDPLARARARARPGGAAGRGRARLRRRGRRGAAGGERVGAARGQARARRGGRPPAASGPRGHARDRRTARGCGSPARSRIRCRCRCIASLPRALAGVPRARPSGRCAARCTAPRRRWRGGCSLCTTPACASPPGEIRPVADQARGRRRGLQRTSSGGRVAAANSSASTRPIRSSGTALGSASF